MKVHLKLILINFLPIVIVAESKSYSDKNIEDNIENIIKSEVKEENVEINPDNTKDKKDKKDKKIKKKRYSNVPSFIGIGVDVFSFIYNLLTRNNNYFNVKSNKYYDFRLKVDTDFNRILLGMQGGYLRWVIKTEDDFERSTNAFFINPNVYYNFLKKNSSRNALYAGGGVNFNGTYFTQKAFNDVFEKYDSYKHTSFHIWFNLELGNRIKIIKFLHINMNFRITFLNFNIKNISYPNYPEISRPYQLYGFGHTNTSYNIEFCVSLVFNINLNDDVYVDKREEYLYM